MNYKISFSCISHIGNVRSKNQDNFICDGQYMEFDNAEMDLPISGDVISKKPTLFGIFDGMGGEECGEIASYIAAKEAAATSLGKDGTAVLKEYCMRSNDKICEYAENNGISSMGTTAALLLFSKKEITLCNIGDSKIFRFSDGKLEQISKDHVALMEFAAKPPLTQNLGIPSTEFVIDPYLAQGKYNDGDIYLICSDGLTDMVTNREIADELANNPFSEALNNLLDKALENGGRDNITIILCKIENNFRWLFKRR